MGNFVKLEQDGFNPEFGDIVWRRRLNQRLEERVKELEKKIDELTKGKK